ncbi:hypothetical protein [Neolewinella agarilytica]|uniref:Uncharacterized protein n=1 Tax=Neolewinella agarilytica TaxID=478744 RepID=A0A1H9LHA8_9BACT|nr:hypothetical protein [Neolewinella agarilytica]SER10806.1 hypothetical protein SAMN05444359_12438 [Neolewinella agarilytica]
MNENIAFLELKYGNIYGGYPNFYAISEIALLVFERGSNKIFLESWINQANVDIVDVYAETDELGHTTRRVREVLNMRTNRRFAYNEEFRLNDDELQYAFRNLRSTKSAVKNFLLKNLRKYRFEDLIVFDGRRDIFLCERSGVNFGYTNIIDIQKDLNRETDYLFSLNKLAKVIDFHTDRSYLRSNNLEYWLHPIAARQIVPGTAAFDAARLLMVFNEYTMMHDDFMIKAAILLNKIQKKKDEEKARLAAEAPEATEEKPKAKAKKKAPKAAAEEE